MAPLYAHLVPAAGLTFSKTAGNLAEAIGGASFWLTAALAATGSLVSALCIADPVSHPRENSNYFVGQCFVWLATALLWATVIVSLAFEPARAFDLLAVILIVGVCRWTAQAICDVKWREGGSRKLGFVFSEHSPHISGLRH